MNTTEEEIKTWDEKLQERLSEFEQYLEEMRKTIAQKHERLVSNLVKLVELSKQAFEPGMDYYGHDYLTQMGIGLKVLELEKQHEPLAYDRILNNLIEDSESRLYWLSRDVEKKKKATVSNIGG